jgi:hypothetical protein
MPYRRSYALTETEILALQLHRNLHGHSTYSEDVQALVDELEQRVRRSDEVEQILNEGRRHLTERKRAG